MLSIPLTLGILLAVFGSLVAAIVPVGLALTAFMAAGGLLALTSRAVHIDGTATSVMLLVGLAVGVDYTLFYLKREREERARGIQPGEALRIAAATSGRSILVSGLTVVAGGRWALPHRQRDLQGCRGGDRARGRDRGARISHRAARH